MAQARIHVSNIAWTTDEAGLREQLSQYGKVTDLYFLTFKKGPHEGKHSGTAFATFQKQEQAAAAIDKMNGMVLDGRTLKVNPAHPRKKKD